METIYPDYNNCITNLACSIAKDFDLEIKNKTIEKLDKLLLNNYKNIIVILYDGMGSKIIDKALDKKSFLQENKLMDLTSTFPATTTAATTSMTTGLNPIEHGYLGWDMYFYDIDEVICLFRNNYKDTNVQYKYNVAKEKLSNNKIIDQINNKTNYKAYGIFPFGDGSYESVETMYERIVNLTRLPNKKYIYAYVENPDYTMHKNGVFSSVDIVKKVNTDIEKLSKSVSKDTLIIVTADHGHIDSDRVVLKEYDDLYKLLERTTSIEPRACSFKVKEDSKKEFQVLFNKYFKEDFYLLEKEEVKEKNLFGTGHENKYFDSAIGDYIAIATNDKYLVYDEQGVEHKSNHAGITTDEMLIPLITISIKDEKKSSIIRKVDWKDHNQIRPLANELQLFNVKNRKDIYMKSDALGRNSFANICSGVRSQIAFVYEDNNKIIGYIEGQMINVIGEERLNHFTYFEIKRIIVKEEYRRQGIGTALYSTIVDYVTKLRCDNIRINVDSFNKEAIKFIKSIDMKKFSICYESKVQKKKKNI